MKFESSVTVDAPRETLWAYLSDFPKASLCLPGVSDVVELADGSYEGTLRMRVGPISLNLSGTVNVTQDEAQGQWRMEAKARDGRIGGGLQAKVDANLTEPTPGKSELRVEADVQFMGRLGQLGLPLIRRKADATIAEFAENLKQAVTGNLY